VLINPNGGVRIEALMMFGCGNGVPVQLPRFSRLVTDLSHVRQRDVELPPGWFCNSPAKVSHGS